MVKYVYEIGGLYAPDLDETRMGMWGFDINLDPSFALKARKAKMEEKLYDNLQRMAVITTTNFKLDDHFGVSIKPNPYHFTEGSLLLQFVEVPGNACDLGIYNGKRELLDNWKMNDNKNPYSVNYIPHNVDTKDQAYCLLSLWIHWANTINLILSKK